MAQSSYRSWFAFLHPLMAFVALLGLADALYLTIHTLKNERIPCGITNGCDEVLTSQFSTFKGIPLSIIGAVAYFSVFSLALLIAFGYRKLSGVLLTLVLAMSLTTGYLLYLQAFVIKHYCQYCLFSAATTILLLLLIIATRWQRRPASAGDSLQ